MKQHPLQAVLVHGAGGGGWEWNVWLGVLRAHGVHAHAPDLHLDVGSSISSSLESYAAQVLLCLRSLPRPRVLVGASLGALVALVCAQEADALILVNPVPPSPWHSYLPARKWDGIVPWARHARLSGTRAALTDCDAASALFAYRRWRDQPAGPLHSAWSGVRATAPECPVLFIISKTDDDIPPRISSATASAWGADCLQTSSSTHAGPLMGETAADTAMQAVAWLNQSLQEASDSDEVLAPAH